MKLSPSLAILAIAAATLAACDRPKTQSTAYNNSGKSAATAPATESTATTPTPTTAPATSDTASPTAASPSGTASGAVSETVTTGKIKAAIVADPGMKDADVTVTTDSGVVTLGGTAKSQDQVALATDIAQRQEGVARVETTIAVK
jgi:hypothetical protein